MERKYYIIISGSFVGIILLVLIIGGFLLGSLVLNSIVKYAWIPIISILACIQIGFIVWSMKNFIKYCPNDSFIQKLFAYISFIFGEIVRATISIAFFACICKNFIGTFECIFEEGVTSGNFLLNIIVYGLATFLDIGLAILIFCASGGLSYFISVLIEEGSAISGGILSLVLSIIFFVLVEALIGYGYPETAELLFSNIPILNLFFTDPILYKIVRLFIS